MAERVLVTGCAGFLGSHLTESLLRDGVEVLGVDCFTPYYPRAIKERNLAVALEEPRFTFRELDLSADPLDDILDGVSTVYHLAAQPGVRLSFGSFDTYLRHNLQATQRLLERAVDRPLRSFTYASSSSVYGATETFPTPETAERRPVSPYGITKLATEELANTYCRTNGVHAVGLRYFTAYGPRQRPDMAMTRFLGRALRGQRLPIFGDGLQLRDFTYVADVVNGTRLAAEHGHAGVAYNIGGGNTTNLLEVVELLRELLGKPIELEHLPAGRGDARHTHADGALAREHLGFEPATALRDGLAAQLEWLRSEVASPELAEASGVGCGR
jgi:nucleoside-diphosphate-sugar epimerase